MIRKSITFEDFDGNEVTEEHYFHLSNAELLAWMGENDEDLGTKLEQTVKRGTAVEIMALFNDIIRRAYGVREGGNSFKKSPEIADRFMNSLAFDAFFLSMLTNAGEAVEFINGVIPSALRKQVLASQDGEPGPLSLEAVGNEAEEDKRSGLERPRDNRGKLVPWAHRKPTRAELQKMSKDQLVDVTSRMSSGWGPTVSSV